MFTWMIVLIFLVAALFVVIGLWLAAAEKARATGSTALPTTTSSPSAEPIAGSPFSRPQPQHRLTGLTLGCLLIFGLVWFSFSLFAAVFSVGWLIEEWRVYTVLKDSGVTLEAVIVDRRVDEDSESDSYYVTYQYRAPLPQGDRQKFSREEEVSEEEYQAMPPETRVAILYDPKAPEISRLQAGFGPPFFGAFMTCFMLLFVLTGLVFLVLAGASLRRLILLAFYSQVTSGVIVDRWVERGSEIDSYCVSYRFQPPQPGASRPITQAEVYYKAYEKLNIGDRVQIRYLPNKPEVCRLMF